MVGSTTATHRRSAAVRRGSVRLVHCGRSWLVDELCEDGVSECLAALASRVERRDILRAQQIQISGHFVEIRPLLPAFGAGHEVHANVIPFSRSEGAQDIAAEQDGMRTAWCLVRNHLSPPFHRRRDAVATVEGPWRSTRPAGTARWRYQKSRSTSRSHNPMTGTIHTHITWCAHPWLRSAGRPDGCAQCAQRVIGP